MERETDLNEASILLGRLVQEVKVKNAAGLFDINRISEDFYLPILSIILECPDLRNLNQIKANFPSVDLGCDTSGVSIQVTSNPSSAKISKTLSLFRAHNLDRQFGRVYVFVITERQATYNSRSLQREIDNLAIDFDPAEHIIDFRDLAQRIGKLSTQQIAAVRCALEEAFAKQDRRLKFRQELENFIKVGQRKIEFEKRSKKYIPAIFVETSSVKEQARLFANPLFFYRKVIDKIAQLDLGSLNELLVLAKQDPIEAPLHALPAAAPATLDDLGAYLAAHAEALSALRANVAPYSMDRGDVERFEPEQERETYRRIWSFPIESRAYGFNRRLDQILEEIRLCQTKIMLITGMAGQGKTNFVCDLVENLFQSFQIPSVFLPARELNGYAGQKRIFDFIVNNRYAPNVDDLHSLLKLFDDVAKETGKPFVIVIDGINEVSDFSVFSRQINDFLSAVSQYDHVKAIVTCRSEFFDQRFASMLHEDFAHHILQIENLHAEMSERHKGRLIEGYFKHFEIGLLLGDDASNFLKNDLLLLRIFCEIEKGAPERRVSTIYKGEVFERFLIAKVGEFDEDLKPQVVPTLHAIVSRMVQEGTFHSLSTAGFSSPEMKIVDRLISEDVVLRSELPEPSLASAGSQNISFTYDELRDFIVAHYLVTDLAERSLEEAASLLDQSAALQIREGVFRYTYILARKQAKSKVLALCERQADFLRHYVNNLELIPPSLQDDGDHARVKGILASGETANDIRALAFFLFRRRNPSDVLTIQILLDHINSLDDAACREFFAIIFSDAYTSWRNDWGRQIGQIVSRYLERAEEGFPIKDMGQLTFMLQIAGFADWDFIQTIYNRFAALLSREDHPAQREYLANAKSDVICRTAEEIWAGVS